MNKMYNLYNEALVASEEEIKCWICYNMDELSKQCAKEKEPATKVQVFRMTVLTLNESGLVVGCLNVCISLYVKQSEDGNDS